MDYRALLAKYIRHMIQEEGTAHIPTYSPELFSPEEEAELGRIAEELAHG